MTRKLTITLDDVVYDGLYRKIGPRRIGKFLESLARPFVTDDGLEAAYQQMAADEQREAEAEEWIEGVVGDVAGETR